MKIKTRKENRRRMSLIIYVVLTLLLLADIAVICKYKVSLAGYWSDRVLFWIWLFATLPFLIFFRKNIVTKIYFAILLLGFLLSIAAMMLPFYAILFSSTGMERIVSYTPKESKYRMQVLGSVMGRPRLEVIENKGILFEKVVISSDAEFLKNDKLKTGYQVVSKIEVTKDNKENMTLKLYTPSDILIKRFDPNGDMIVESDSGNVDRDL